NAGNTFTTPTVSVTVNNGPAAPSNLVATGATTSSVSLRWTDNSTNEQGFYIERAAGTVGGAFTRVGTVSANVTTFTSTGLTTKTTYRFRVQSFNAGGV